MMCECTALVDLQGDGDGRGRKNGEDGDDGELHGDGTLRVYLKSIVC